MYINLPVWQLTHFFYNLCVWYLVLVTIYVYDRQLMFCGEFVSVTTYKYIFVATFILYVCELIFYMHIFCFMVIFFCYTHMAIFLRTIGFYINLSAYSIFTTYVYGILFLWQLNYVYKRLCILWQLYFYDNKLNIFCCNFYLKCVATRVYETFRLCGNLCT